jgi:hypothetical protein
MAGREPAIMTFFEANMSRYVRVWVAPALSVVAVLASPSATADGDSPSYLQGKQAIDQQVYTFHVQLQDDGTLGSYCKSLLQNSLRTGQILRVESPTDYINGCQDEARATLAPPAKR